MLVSLSETEKNFSLLNVKESLEFLFNGISCYDISLLDPYDFVVFMAKFIEQRKISGKVYHFFNYLLAHKKVLAVYVCVLFFLITGFSKSFTAMLP